MAMELVDTNSLGSGKGCRRRERRRWGWGRGRRDDGQGLREEVHGNHGRHGAADHPGECERHGRRGTCAAHGHGAAAHTQRRLCEAGAGDTVTVTGLLGDEAFRGRIMAMGILPGTTLKVVGGGGRQPLLVALPGSRCVVDQRSSEMIAVRGARPAAKHERTTT
jgi:Fe2+ transport system protein FeoA